MADIFDGLKDWLIDRALTENPFDVTLKAFAARLLDAGVPVARISVGQVLLHPAIGLLDTEWDGDTGLVQTRVLPRASVVATISDKTPFGRASLSGVEGQIVADLTDPEDRARFALFGELAARGFTFYAAFSRRFGQKQHIFDGMDEDFRGMSVSFATRRSGGLTEGEIAGLARVIAPLAVCLRVASERFLTTELLSHYLGRTSGEKVYEGRSARGDGERMHCVLLFSDLRGSLALAETLALDDYLATANRYFDCTAAAVLDHGGEVLKFIGDGILAIFPVRAGTRPAPAMCAAALAAARDAFRRAEAANAKASDQPPIRFGMALHLGEVIYGNVGTAKRHDFTATGAAVGLVARIEGLTRDLERPLLTSGDFADALGQPGQPLGTRALRGIEQPVRIVAYDPGTPS